MTTGIKDKVAILGMGCSKFGERYDCGSKLGYLKAQVEYALQHNELSGEFLAYLHERFGENGTKIAALIKSA